MKVGDTVTLVRVYGSQEIELPAIVLAADKHKRIRHKEGTEDFVTVNPKDDSFEGVVDVTDAPPLADGCVHVAFFSFASPTVRLEYNVPTKKSGHNGVYVVAK